MLPWHDQNQILFRECPVGNSTHSLWTTVLCVAGVVINYPKTSWLSFLVFIAGWLSRLLFCCYIVVAIIEICQSSVNFAQYRQAKFYECPTYNITSIGTVNDQIGTDDVSGCKQFRAYIYEALVSNICIAVSFLLQWISAIRAFIGIRYRLRYTTNLTDNSHNCAIKRAMKFFWISIIFIEIPCSSILGMYGTAIGFEGNAVYATVNLLGYGNNLFFLSWLGGIIFPLMLTTCLTFVVVDARKCLTMLDRMIEKVKDQSIRLEDYKFAQGELAIVSRRSLWIYGQAVVVCMLNAIIAIVVLFLYRDSNPYDSFNSNHHITSLDALLIKLVAVVLLYFKEVLFIWFALSEITAVNEKAIEFTQILCSTSWQKEPSLNPLHPWGHEPMLNNSSSGPDLPERKSPLPRDDFHTDTDTDIEANVPKGPQVIDNIQCCRQDQQVAGQGSVFSTVQQQPNFALKSDKSVKSKVFASPHNLMVPLIADVDDDPLAVSYQYSVPSTCASESRTAISDVMGTALPPPTSPRSHDPIVDVRSDRAASAASSSAPALSPSAPIDTAVSFSATPDSYRRKSLHRTTTNSQRGPYHFSARAAEGVESLPTGDHRYHHSVTCGGESDLQRLSIGLAALSNPLSFSVLGIKGLTRLGLRLQLAGIFFTGLLSILRSLSSSFAVAT